MDTVTEPKGASRPPGSSSFVARSQQKLFDKRVKAASPLLPPGTTIRQCVDAGTKSPWIYVVMALPLAIIPAALVFMAINRSRLIAVTDDAIYVLDCGRNANRPKRVMAVFPRTTRLGPCYGLFPKVTVGTETLYVARAASGEIMAADNEAAHRSPAGSAVSMPSPPPAGVVPPPPGAPAGSCSLCGAPRGAGVACPSCRQVEGLANDVRMATAGRRLGGYVLDTLLIFATLLIGWLVWSFIVWKDGVSPAKQLLGLRVVKLDTRQSASWGTMALRELVVKWVVFPILFVIPPLPIVLAFMLVWDKNRQQLWDKIAGTIVVEEPAR